MVFIRRTRQDWADFIFNFNWNQEKKTKIRLSTSSRSCHDVSHMWIHVYDDIGRLLIDLPIMQKIVNFFSSFLTGSDPTVSSKCRWYHRVTGSFSCGFPDEHVAIPCSQKGDERKGWRRINVTRMRRVDGGAYEEYGLWRKSWMSWWRKTHGNRRSNISLH